MGEEGGKTALLAKTVSNGPNARESYAAHALLFVRPTNAMAMADIEKADPKCG
jgi:hypothetical protein